MKQIVEKMTLKTFSSDKIADLQEILEESYDNAVYLGGIMNMTNFFSSTVLYERRKRMHGIISELSF